VDLGGSPIPVSAGETLAAVITSTGDYRWGGASAGGYAPGQALQNTGGGFASAGGTDLGFRSYVALEPAAVPAARPALLLSLAAALLVLGTCSTKRIGSR
jgi:hypothetical protein